MPAITLKEIREFKHRINPEERQGAYGYYFIRPFSIYLTYLALRFGLSANQVTVLQALFGVAGAVLLGFPHTAMILLGLAFLQFGFVLDNVDGEVARFRRQVSVSGKFLDSIGHSIVVPFMFFGLGVGTYFRLGHFESVIFGFLAGLFSLRFDFSVMYQEAAQLLESKLDQAYDYYAKFEFEDQQDQQKLYRRKNEASPVRMLYALFAYPATMNIITVLYVVDLILRPFSLKGYDISLIYLFLAVYGLLLPVRRCFTIWKLVKGRETEKKYIKLLHLLRASEPAGSKKQPKSDPNR